MDKKLKLYIDTSVWNFALEIERADSILTYEFLKLTVEEKCDIFVSEIVVEEIEDAYEPRRSKLFELLSLTNTSIIYVNDEMKKLANTYVNEGLLPVKHINDALHIAIATVSRCHLIISWNFNHIVKAKVIMGVHHVNHREGYGLIEIVSPQLFLGKKE